MGPRLVALLIALAVVVAGCSSSEDPEAVEPTPTATATPTPTISPTPTATPTPTPEPQHTISVASLNSLHGFFCPAETDWCDAPTRLEILWEHVEAAGCPDVVALQEIAPRQVELIAEQLPPVCGGVYENVLFEASEPPDQEMILTRLGVTADGVADLANFPWTAHWAVLDAPMGPVAIVATHFASDANNPDCTADNCPPDLCAEGMETGSCHALQVLELIDAVGAGTVAQLIVGDLNEPLDHPRIQILTEAGFVDSWTEAGHPECDPATGAGCTCCIDGPEPLGGLDIAEQVMGGRIDFVLVRGAAACPVGLAAEDVSPFAASPLAKPRNGLYWASDHGGVLADVTC